MGRKFKFSKLRELHAAIGALIDESDAGMAGAAGADEDDDTPAMDNPPPTPGTPRPPTANDSALREGVSMHVAFKGFKAWP